jgi:hypothetical protein
VIDVTQFSKLEDALDAAVAEYQQERPKPVEPQRRVLRRAQIIMSSTAGGFGNDSGRLWFEVDRRGSYAPEAKLLMTGEKSSHTFTLTELQMLISEAQRAVEDLTVAQEDYQAVEAYKDSKRNWENELNDFKNAVRLAWRKAQGKESHDDDDYYDDEDDE